MANTRALADSFGGTSTTCSPAAMLSADYCRLMVEAGAIIVGALITAVIAHRAADNRERRAVKAEAELLAALPNDLPSKAQLQELLDQHLKRYVLNQTSIGQGIVKLGAWVVVTALVVSWATLYLESDSAPDWADGWGDLWDSVGGAALTAGWIGVVLSFVGGVFWLLESWNVHGLRRAGLESIRDFARYVRETWRVLGEHSRRPR